MLVTRSTDGGRTWEAPVTLIRDTNRQILNDKNSITADPTRPELRLRGLGPAAGLHRAAEARAAASRGGRRAPGIDGVGVRRRGAFRQRGAGSCARLGRAAKAPAGRSFFTGPTYLSRTTNGGKTWSKPPEDLRPRPERADDRQPDRRAAERDGHRLLHPDLPRNGEHGIELIRSLDNGQTLRAGATGRSADQSSAVGSVITPDKQEPVRDAPSCSTSRSTRRTATSTPSGRTSASAASTRSRSRCRRDGGDRPGRQPVRDQPDARQHASRCASRPSSRRSRSRPNGMLVVTYYDFRNDRTTGGEATDYWAVFCDPGKSNCANTRSGAARCG